MIDNFSILIPIDDLTGNDYISGITQSTQDHKLSFGTTLFFDIVKYFDIIHIQWPEAFFDWRAPSTDDLLRLEQTLLNRKRKGSHIILTRHNLHPHSKNESMQRAYDICIASADCFIHLGSYSYHLDKKGYPNKIHRIINHPLYDLLPNTLTQTEARIKLNIPENKTVMLCFGQIRSFKELLLVFKGFRLLKKKHKFLYISHYPHLGSLKRQPAIRIRNYLLGLKSVWKKSQYRFEKGFVERDDVQLILNAADIIFIPRLDTLNSGNVFLGATFGKVIIGPDVGNIGAALKEWGMPTYAIHVKGSIRLAFDKAAILIKQGYGVKNLAKINKFCCSQEISEQHDLLYRELMRIPKI